MMLYRLKVDVREPYMGNQVPLKIEVTVDEGKLAKVLLINPEGIVHVARLITKEGQRDKG